MDEVQHLPPQDFGLTERSGARETIAPRNAMGDNVTIQKNWQEPVSYTHLDVYKRQAIDAGLLDAAGKVDAAALIKAGLMRRAKDGVRLLGAGEIKAKVTFSVYGASKSAVAAVEKAGGSVEILAPKAQTSEQAA